MGQVGQHFRPIDRPGKEVVVVDGPFEPGGVLPTNQRGAPCSAVGTNGIDRIKDQRHVPDALGNGWQVEGIKHGRL
jgi:hypothetical protein